jgi:hypothetical protein
MLRVTDVAREGSNFVITFNDGTVLNLSSTDFAASVASSRFSPFDLELDASQLDAVADLAAASGETIGEFIESAVLEKLLRDK